MTPNKSNSKKTIKMKTSEIEDKEKYVEVEPKLRAVVAKAKEALEEIQKPLPDRVKILTLVAEDMEELIVDAGNTLLRGSIPSDHNNISI